MSDPFIAEMRIVPFGFAPRYWAMCDGATMAINQNTALFRLLGTTFGGNGVSTFMLPDMRGRVPVGAGHLYPAGSTGGEETHMLLPAEVQSHSHKVQGVAAKGTTPLLPGNIFGTVDSAVYAPPPAVTKMSPQSVSTVGGTAHPNLQPYQVVAVAIALSGIHPTPN